MELAKKMWPKSRKIKGIAVPLHDVIDNKDSYRNRGSPIQNFKSLKTRELIYGRIKRGGEDGGKKYEGICRDVVENKCRKNVRFVPLHDVDENTRVISFSPLC